MGEVTRHTPGGGKALRVKGEVRGRSHDGRLQVEWRAMANGDGDRFVRKVVAAWVARGSMRRGVPWCVWLRQRARKAGVYLLGIARG